MKFVFTIKDNQYEEIYNDKMKIIEIKKDLLKKYFDETTTYLDFIFENDKPIKHFGKLYLEPGVIPTTMDKFSLNRFSIDNVKCLNIKVIENNTIDLIKIYDNILNNKVIINPNIKRQNEQKQQQFKKQQIDKQQQFIYKEEDFPSL